MSAISTACLQKKLNEVQTSVLASMNKNQYVCVFGPTGGAKSSLIACMINFKKVTFQQRGLAYHFKHSQGTKMPKIGNTSVSQTQIPTLYQKGQTNFIDLPGIFDTKGSFQEIINAYANSMVFRSKKSFKFIIVVEVSSILEKRGSTFVNVIARMEELLEQNFPHIASACSLVISKTNKHQQLKAVQESLENILRQHQGIQPGTNRFKLVRSILKNKQLHLFPLPDILTAQSINLIEDKVQTLKAFQIVEDSKMSLSSEAINNLENILSQKLTDLQQNISAVQKIIQKQYNIRYSSESEAYRKLQILQKAQSDEKKLDETNMRRTVQELLQKLTPGNKENFKNLRYIYKELQILKRIQTEDFKHQLGLVKRIFSTIKNCSAHIEQQIQRIQNERQKQRIRREQQLRREEQERMRQQQIRRIQEQQRIRQYEYRRQLAQLQHRLQRQRLIQQQRLQRQRVRLQLISLLQRLCGYPLPLSLRYLYDLD